MKNYIDTVALLENEPEKWLAQKSMLNMKAFFDGFGNTDVLETNIELLTPFINGFSRSLSEKYHDNTWFELFKAGYNDSDVCALYLKDLRTFCLNWQYASGDFPKRQVQMVDISRTLKHIRSRYGMYFACPSVSLLFSYLRGVQWCCDCYTTGARLVPNIQQFETWLCREFGLDKACRWDRLLLLENGFNEQTAFEKFFVRLDQFGQSGV